MFRRSQWLCCLTVSRALRNNSCLYPMCRECDDARCCEPFIFPLENCLPPPAFPLFFSPSQSQGALNDGREPLRLSCSEGEGRAHGLYWGAFLLSLSCPHTLLLPQTLVLPRSGFFLVLFSPPSADPGCLPFQSGDLPAYPRFPPFPSHFAAGSSLTSGVAGADLDLGYACSRELKRIV